MILITKTYAEITPESADLAGYSKVGILESDQPYTFRELVHAMCEHKECSEYPISDSIFTWFSSGFYMIDYHSGVERETSIHYSRSNPSRNAKYWSKAIRLIFNKNR